VAIHPIGLPFAICSYPINYFFVSIFLAGPRSRVCCEWAGFGSTSGRSSSSWVSSSASSAACGISFVVDMIWFPGRGHPLYGY